VVGGGARFKPRGAADTLPLSLVGECLERGEGKGCRLGTVGHVGGEICGGPRSGDGVAESGKICLGVGAIGRNEKPAPRNFPGRAPGGTTAQKREEDRRAGPPPPPPGGGAYNAAWRRFPPSSITIK